MRNRFLGSLLLVASIGGAIVGSLEAQGATKSGAFSPELLANLEKLRDAALASDYAWREVSHLTENIGPRLDGSPQSQAAVQYVADELRSLGLTVTLEKVMVPHWVRGEERAELTSFPGQPPGVNQKIVLTALGNSRATPPEGLTPEVVVVDSFDELTRLGRKKVVGRIVLFNEKFDMRMAAAGHAGAAYGEAVAIDPHELAENAAAMAVLAYALADVPHLLPRSTASR